MENSGYGLTSTYVFPDQQGLVPPYSPVVFEPVAKHPYPYNIDFSRDPARVRTIFNAYVRKAKEMNSEKADIYSGKLRARNLCLKVDIDQAKCLHWRSIQARQPVVLTDSPNSPLKTPRRPVNDYPSAEALYAKNMADAQERQDYFESYRWSLLAERERAISEWEVEQMEASRVSRETTSPTSSESPSAEFSSANLHETDRAGPTWYNTLIPSITSLSPARPDNSIPAVDHMSDSLRNRVTVDIPLSRIDGSQKTRSDPVDSHFVPTGQNGAYNLSSSTDDLFPQGMQMCHGLPIRRHIPEEYLGVVPTSLLPKINFFPESYSSPQDEHLSHTQSDTGLSAPTHIFQNIYTGNSDSNTSSSLSATFSSLSSLGPAAPEGNVISLGISSHKKRRSSFEHPARATTPKEETSTVEVPY